MQLRDELRNRGKHRTVVPASVPTEAPSVDVIAIVQRVAPICEVLYLLMVADDRTDARELDVMRGAIRVLTENALRSSVITGMLERFEVNANQYGREARLAQVTGQLSADRQDAEAAYTLAAVMAIADESSDEEERAWLEELRQMLGIKPARAAELLGGLDYI